MERKATKNWHELSRSVGKPSRIAITYTNTKKKFRHCRNMMVSCRLCLFRFRGFIYFVNEALWDDGKSRMILSGESYGAAAHCGGVWLICLALWAYVAFLVYCSHLQVRAGKTDLVFFFFFFPWILTSHVWVSKLRKKIGLFSNH